jgi:type IV secretion system protein TrbE
MFNLKEYRKTPDRLSDLLPWAALVAPGVVLNKDGSLQRTLRFRGLDLESATEPQLVASAARLNNALRRFGSGWAIYIEARRQHYSAYPAQAQSHFPDVISLLVDAERRERFAADGDNFESQYYLTLQFLPQNQAAAKLSDLFLTKPQRQRAAQLNATGATTAAAAASVTAATKAIKEEAHQENLDFFLATTNRFHDILQDFMFETTFLNDEETLTYLHETVSPKQHPIRPPETPLYLDSFLADTPLLAGMAPQLGGHHLRTISILSFPTHTLPALLDQLNQLPLCYRWVTRFIPLDKSDAEKQLKGYKRRWFARRKGFFNVIQEIFTKSESQLLDTASVDKAKDVDMAMKELAEDYVSFGYYTATVTVMDSDPQRVAEMQREIERVINGLGFTTIAETFNAVEAWLSSLPGHAYANVRAPLLHSLNLAHIIPFSAIWSGQAKDYLLNAPAHMYVQTSGRTPFRLVNHIGDVGHQMVVGPTGAGKSVLLTMMALQFRRYKNAQVFIFDKGGSFLASTHGVDGGYYELGLNKHSLAFQPLALIDQEAERIWAAEWVYGLLINENLVITPELKQVIWDGLTSLSHMPQTQRTITGLCALLQNNKLRQALTTYSLKGAFGHLLDADYEQECNEDWQCYEMEELMSMPSVVAPVLAYLFHRLGRRFTGAPTLLILDEAWLFLDHPVFAEQIRDWLKTLRKANVSVVFATQSIADSMNSNIAPALIESCPARILLPNDRILEPSVSSYYERLGLNERQLQILATATPKLQYYYQSRLGNRLFNLELGPLALAFCAASRPEDKQLIKELLNECGYKEFLQKYLRHHQLDWVVEILENISGQVS